MQGDGLFIPDARTWYTRSHSDDFDVVWQHQIKHTDWGYTSTTRTLIINYKDSNGNGIWDKEDSRSFVKYGTQTKSYYEFGTPEQHDSSPYIQTGGLGSITDEFRDQLNINVNGHLDCDCYVDLVPRSRLAVGPPHR